jgi:hypothetical protein
VRIRRSVALVVAVTVLASACELPAVGPFLLGAGLAAREHACAVYVKGEETGYQPRRIHAGDLTDMGQAADDAAWEDQRDASVWTEGIGGRTLLAVSDGARAVKVLAEPAGATVLSVVSGQDQVSRACAATRRAGPVYALLLPSPTAYSETLLLGAFDPTTGTEAWRIELVGVRGGTIAGRDRHESQLVRKELPGAALSPDSSLIAVMHVDGDALTLVDTRSRERRTVLLTHRGPALGIGAIAAAAKVLDDVGKRWSVALSPDGRLLYAAFGEGRENWIRGAAVRAIDVERGEIVARWPGGWPPSPANEIAFGEELEWTAPTPDATGVYLLTRKAYRPYGVLRRFEGRDLRVVAERRFDAVPLIRILPAR